jgi:dTDP-4-dehydrorhamnose reductase
MKILILGISGLLGNMLFRKFSENKDIEVFGTYRNYKNLDKRFLDNRNICFLTVDDLTNLNNLIESLQPDIIINCIGIIKQLNCNPSVFYRINSSFPLILSHICKNSKIIQISSDCVFSGAMGDYRETDIPDAIDDYGKSKFLGELLYPNLTIRTSMIGHEINSKNSLLEWFLSQKKKVNGFSKALYSGFTTLELYNIIYNYVMTNNLSGIYHVSSTPINKYELLKLIAKVYKKKIKIEKDESFICDRTLNSDKFKMKTGHVSPSWSEMIESLYKDFKDNKNG